MFYACSELDEYIPHISNVYGQAGYFPASSHYMIHHEVPYLNDRIIYTITSPRTQ